MFEKNEGLTAKDFKSIFNEGFVKPILRKDGFKGSGYVFYKDMGTHYLYFQLLGSAKYGGFDLLFGIYFKKDNCIKKGSDLSYHDLDFEKTIRGYKKNGILKNTFIEFNYGKDTKEANKIILNIIKIYNSIGKGFYLNIENYKNKILTVNIDDIKSYLKEWLKVLHKNDDINNKWYEESVLSTKIENINLIFTFQIIAKIFHIDGQADMSNKILELDKEFLLENHLIREIYLYLDKESKGEKRDGEYLTSTREEIRKLEEEFLISKEKGIVINNEISLLLEKI